MCAVKSMDSTGVFLVGSSVRYIDPTMEQPLEKMSSLETMAINHKHFVCLCSPIPPYQK